MSSDGVPISVARVSKTVRDTVMGISAGQWPPDPGASWPT